MIRWCITLDVDDTLYLERDYVRSGFAAVGAWLADNRGAPGFSERAWGAFERGVRGNTFNLVLDEMSIEPTSELIRQLIGVYRRHAPDIALLPDARACLDALQADDLIEPAFTAITDGPASSQRAKLKALDVARWADPIMVTAELGEGMSKPHPEAYRRVQAATGVPPERCVYLADNPHKDFIAPRALGWRTLRIRRPGGLHVDAPGGDDIDRELPDMSRVVEVLRGWS